MALEHGSGPGTRLPKDGAGVEQVQAEPLNAYVSEITVIKNLNSRIHKRLPTPNTANCIAVPSFKVMCPGMCDYGTGT